MTKEIQSHECLETFKTELFLSIFLKEKTSTEKNLHRLKEAMATGTC